MIHIKNLIKSSIDTKLEILNDENFIQKIQKCVEIITFGYQKDCKVLLCGNGGSAADAQHIAAEFSGRFLINRKPLQAEALHTNTSYITAVSNDFGFEYIYSRMVECIGKKGDILIAFSTSGTSPNIINALIMAKKLGLVTIGLTGQNGTSMEKICDVALIVPSESTPRIQESHILIGHIICELVENNLFITNSNS